MTRILQYYKKNMNLLKGLIIIVTLLIANSIYSQSANFTFTREENCSHQIHFQNTSSFGTQYLWDFGDSVLVENNDVSFLKYFIDEGSYQITLYAIEGAVTMTHTETITIATGPTASFEYDQTNGCVPLRINFTNTSAAGDTSITEVSWDFRDGNIYHNPNSISFNYTKVDTYEVYISVTDANGCKDDFTITNLVELYEQPVPSFQVSDSFSCSVPMYVNFINNTVEDLNMTYLWDFGNGTTSNARDTSIIYNTEGDYSISLIVQNEHGCQAEIEKPDYISVGHETLNIYGDQGYLTVSAGDTLCKGYVEFIPSVSRNVSYRWVANYGNTTLERYDESIEFEQIDSDSIEITLFYGSGTACPDSTTRVFQIDTFDLDFVMDKDSVCQLPATINFKASAVGANNLEWLIMPDDVRIEGDTINYTFNNSNSYSNEYSHVINQNLFPVTLNASYNRGCRFSVTKDFKANLPIARFLPDKVSGCIPLEVNFSDESKSFETIVNRTYILGEDTLSRPDESDFSYTFTQAGIYPVSKIIENDSGCTDQSVTVYIQAGDKTSPDLTVTPYVLCHDDVLTLNAISPINDSIDSWSFFSDGMFQKTSGESNITVNMSSHSTGAKNILLSADFNGCVSDTILTDAFYLSGPAGYFTEEFDCEDPMNYTFVSHVEYASSINWEINSMVYNDRDTLSYMFPGSGDYKVVMTATNDTSGCSLVKTKEIKVRNVSANFTLDSTNCGNILSVDASLSNDFIDSCYSEGFLWDFGDDTKPERVYLSEHEHIYAGQGDYEVKLYVTADNGCIDSTTRNVKIIIFEPDFSLSNSIGCVPAFDVNFTRESINPEIAHWTWDFGDETGASNINSVTHEYTGMVSQVFFITLEETDYYDCQASTTLPFHLYKPNTSFSASETFLCPGQQTTFSILRPYYDSYHIDFGDGDTSISNLNHIYQEEGDYTVSLTIEHLGCESTRTIQDYITVTKVSAKFEVSDSVFNCYPERVDFDHSLNTAPVVNAIWTFNDNFSSTTYSPTPSFTYSEPGIYNASLFFETFNGCSDYYEQTISVSGPEADIYFTPQVICYGEEVHFTASNITDAEFFFWEFDDGQTSPEISPVHQYFAEGSLEPVLVLQNGTCEVPVTYGNLQVSRHTASFVINHANRNYCLPDTLTATNTTSGTNAIYWYLNNQNISNTINVPSIAVGSLGQGSHLIRQISSNARGCSDTADITFNVIENPDFTIEGDHIVCNGETGSIYVASPGAGWQITWQPTTGISDPDGFTTNVSPLLDQTYTATISDQNGCMGIDTIYITVPSTLEITDNLSTDTINLGESIQLFVEVNKENVTYSWDPHDWISCTDCQNPVVSPEEDLIYMVEVSDECTSETTSFPIVVYDEYYIEAPTAFTPNGDMNNDVFMLQTYNIEKLLEFKIFNRWGNIVFETDNLDEGWDGKVNDKLQNPDTYAFFVRAKTIFGTEVIKQGSVVLLR